MQRAKSPGKFHHHRPCTVKPTNAIAIRTATVAKRHLDESGEHHQQPKICVALMIDLRLARIGSLSLLVTKGTVENWRANQSSRLHATTSIFQQTIGSQGQSKESFQSSPKLPKHDMGAILTLAGSSIHGVSSRALLWSLHRRHIRRVRVANPGDIIVSLNSYATHEHLHNPILCCSNRPA